MNTLQTLRDGLAIVREVILVILLLLVLTAPGWINQRLIDAGFTSGSIAGFDWEARIRESQEKVERANAEVVSLQNELVAISETLNAIDSQPLDREARSQIRRLELKVDSSRTNIDAINESLRKSVTEHQNIIRDLKSGNAPD
jgi:hypothetical protein